MAMARAPVARHHGWTRFPPFRYDESRLRRDVYLVDEVKLYLETVLPAVASADTDGRPVVDSSPSNGLLSSRPYVKRWGEPQAVSWGDIHYYNYESDCEDPNTYPPARFISEHGFLAWPSLSQYANVSTPADWSRDSAFSRFRMRHAGGTAQAEAMMRQHFHVPLASAIPGGRSQARLFDDWLWLTQAQQARCYETAFARWRRDRSSAAGTMGILYWQLNAIWQGPDWSTLEHDGTPRLAHFAVARAYAPLLLTAVSRPPGARAAATPEAAKANVAPTLAPLFVDAHLVSDLRAPVFGTLSIQTFRWADAPASPVGSISVRVTVGALTAELVWTGDVAPMLAGATPAQAFVRLTLCPDAVAANLMAGAGQPPVPLVSFHWLTPLRDATLACAAPRLISVERISASAAVVHVASNATAVLVSAHCDAIPGAFSDGVLTLLGGASPLPLHFEADRPFELTELRACLRFRSLRDTWD
jgi:beta-mannosidase